MMMMTMMLMMLRMMMLRRVGNVEDDDVDEEDQSQDQDPKVWHCSCKFSNLQLKCTLLGLVTLCKFLYELLGLWRSPIGLFQL